MDYTALLISLIPPILTITLVFITKRVILSFGAGIISAGLLVVSFDPIKFISIIWNTFFGTIFEKDGYLNIFNEWNISILYFLLVLGIITALLVLGGGTKALTRSVLKRVKTRRGAQYIAALLGILIFIDDYFNALVVGNVSKPIATEQKISRAKLAYIVDATSAPICVISPVSSWATSIIGQIGIVLGTAGLSMTAFSAFIQTIPFHFYVLTSLGLVFVTILFNINIGSMRKYEEQALSDLDLSIVDSEAHTEFEIADTNATGWTIFGPLLALVLSTLGAMFYTGFKGADTFTFINVLDNIDLSTSLRFGGTIGLIVTIVFLNGDIKLSQVNKALRNGTKSMLRPISILIFAWVMASLIGELDTGYHLSELITQANINPYFLPLIIFILSALMAFATGTSWGTFEILIPLGGGIAIAMNNPEILIPTFAAILSGSIFGDHASPISDTTLLSSAGSGCDHGVHFSTQLPYALISAITAGLGYLVFGLTTSLILSYIVIIGSITLLVVIYKHIEKNYR